MARCAHQPLSVKLGAMSFRFTGDLSHPGRADQDRHLRHPHWLPKLPESLEVTLRWPRIRFSLSAGLGLAPAFRFRPDSFLAVWGPSDGYRSNPMSFRTARPRLGQQGVLQFRHSASKTRVAAVRAVERPHSSTSLLDHWRELCTRPYC